MKLYSQFKDFSYFDEPNAVPCSIDQNEWCLLKHCVIGVMHILILMLLFACLSPLVKSGFKKSRVNMCVPQHSSDISAASCRLQIVQKLYPMNNKNGNSVLVALCEGNPTMTNSMPWRHHDTGCQSLSQFIKIRIFPVKIHVINKDFQTWHLIGWRHSRQPIRSHVKKSCLLTWISTWLLLGNPGPGNMTTLQFLKPIHYCFWYWFVAK